MKRVLVFGSTGSIGRSVLEVIRANRERFRVFALCCDKNVELLRKQALEFSPKAVYVASGLDPKIQGVKFYQGDGWRRLLEEVEFDLFISASSGSSGFLPTMTALSMGKTVLLANKETVVMGGKFLGPYLERIVPLDSEHSSIFRLLRFISRDAVKNVFLTASGGPFLNLPLEDMDKVSPDEAVKHPNWPMGKKISVDSATMMNKGLEVMEAHYLFGFSVDSIKVVIHRESMVHAMVEVVDGTVFSHMYPPDMRVPIQYGLFYPDSPPGPALDEARMSLEKSFSLSFSEVDRKRFPSLSLCYEALREGESSPIVLNAANDVAVSLFLSGCISFGDIYRLVREVLERFPKESVESIDDALDIDRRVRELSRRVFKAWKS